MVLKSSLSCRGDYKEIHLEAIDAVNRQTQITHSRHLPHSAEKTFSGKDNERKRISTAGSWCYGLASPDSLCIRKIHPLPTDFHKI